MKIIQMLWLGVVIFGAVACSSSTDSSGGAGAGGTGSGGTGSGGTGNGGTAGMSGAAGSSCLHCGAAVLGKKLVSDVCPASVDLYHLFTDCTCTGKCATMCAATCADLKAAPTADCSDCVFKAGDMGCGDEFAMCTADK